MVNLEPNKMFHTPEHMMALMDWIEKLNGQEKVIAYTAAGMAWNLAAKLANDESDENDKVEFS